MSTNNESQKGLRKGAIGLTAVLFMAVANAAPITAMSFNVPIGAGYGNGLGVPAGFLFATIVLSIFAIGFSAMAKHITTAGAFYGFISHGLGQVWGMAAGLLATIAYILFEGTLIGGFAFFAANTLSSMAGISAASPKASMPPAEVPQIRSKCEAMGRPSTASSSARTVAVYRPR